MAWRSRWPKRCRARPHRHVSSESASCRKRPVGTRCHIPTGNPVPDMGSCQIWCNGRDEPTEADHLSGWLNPGSGYVNDRYVMSIRQQAASLQNAKSPWGGMSGAPLFCGRLLTGVIALDPANRGHSQLEAVPSYLLLSNPEFRAAVAAHTEIPASALAMEPAEWQELAEFDKWQIFRESAYFTGRAAQCAPAGGPVPWPGRHFA